MAKWVPPQDGDVEHTPNGIQILENCPSSKLLWTAARRIAMTRHVENTVGRGCPYCNHPFVFRGASFLWVCEVCQERVDSLAPAYIWVPVAVWKGEGNVPLGVLHLTRKVPIVRPERTVLRPRPPLDWHEYLAVHNTNTVTAEPDPPQAAQALRRSVGRSVGRPFQIHFTLNDNPQPE